MKKNNHLLGRVSIAVIFIGALLCSRAAAADTLTLMWDRNPEPEVTGYIVYVGTASGEYSQTHDVGNTNSFVFPATAGQRYYFAVAAYAGFTVSGLSAEVSGEASGTSNAIPYFYSPGNQQSTVGAPVSLQLVGGDSLGEAVTYSAAGLPSGLTLGAGTGRITGAAAAAGSYSVTVTVSDGLLSTQGVFTWTVVQPGTIPPGSPSTGDSDPTTALVRSLRESPTDQVLTGTRAIARPTETSAAPTMTGTYTGTAALRRTSSPATTIGPAPAPGTYTGTAAVTRSGATSAPAGPSTLVYTGTRAATRTMREPTETSDTLSYTGTLATLRGEGEASSSTGSLLPTTRTATRALETSSSADSTQTMTRSGSGTLSSDGTALSTSSQTAPVVIIQTPVEGASFPSRATVMLSALAHDAEDGDLASWIVWSSSVQGSLGRGGTLPAVFEDGVHVVTATVSDRSGAVHSARVTIVVGQ